jgi:hypothetical protein
MADTAEWKVTIPGSGEFTVTGDAGWSNDQIEAAARDQASRARKPSGGSTLEQRIDKILGDAGAKTKKERPMLSEAVSEAQGDIPRIMNQINEDAIAGTVGASVDAGAAALRFFGAPVGDMPVMGSDWLRQLMRSAGASAATPEGETDRPRSGAGKAAAGMVGGAVESVLSGGGIGTGIKKLGERFGKPALEKTGEVLRNVRGNIAAGVGGGLGGEAATEATKGTPLEKPARFVGEIVGGGLAGVADPAVALRLARQQIVDPIIDAYERLNLVPSAAERGNPTSMWGRTSQWLQGNILPQTAGGGGAIEGFRIKRMRDLHNLQQNIAGEFGDVRARERMGSDIQDAITDTWEQAKTKDGEIIGGLRAKYGDDDVFAGALANAVNKPLGGAVTEEAKEMTMDPLMLKMRDIVRNNKGRMKFGDLAAYKTMLGYALEPGLQKNVNDAQVGQLFNAVRQDMESHILSRSQSDYDALKASNKRYGDAQEQFSAHFKKLVQSGKVPISAERAYDIMQNAGTEKGRGDMEKFRQVWDTLSPTVRGDLTATILGRMGATDLGNVNAWETWQVGKFLTSWRSITPEAKDMLFKNKPDVREKWDDLVTVLDNIQTRIAKLASTSKSGTGGIMLGQMGVLPIIAGLFHGWSGAAEALVFGLGGPWTAAHMLTDARLVDAVTTSVKKMGDGIDGAARAAINLGAVPKTPRRKPTVPTTTMPQVPVSQ